MNHPCFDDSTKKDCPDRHVRCAITCSKWEEYVKWRDNEYKERIRKAELNNVVTEAGFRNLFNSKKDKTRRSRRRK